MPWWRTRVARVKFLNTRSPQYCTSSKTCVIIHTRSKRYSTLYAILKGDTRYGSTGSSMVYLCIQHTAHNKVQVWHTWYHFIATSTGGGRSRCFGRMSTQSSFVTSSVKLPGRAWFLMSYDVCILLFQTPKYKYLYVVCHRVKALPESQGASELACHRTTCTGRTMGY